MKRAILLVCLCLAAACSRGNDNAERKRSAAPVRLAVARIQDVPRQIENVGYVAASNKVAVRSRVMGHLLEVRFAEGDDVREGQILFVLDERPFAAAMREARARLERDRAQMLKARDDMRRFQGLSSKGFTSQEQYEQARTDALALEATVMADEAAVEQAKLQLDYCTIAAPISGRAGAVLQNRGNLIKANDDSPMLSIDCLEPIYVYFAVPEAHLPAIRNLMQQETARTRILPQGSPPDQAVLGTLSFIDNSVDMRTGTIRLRTESPNTDRLLWPGQFVSVSLRLGEHKNAVVIPSAAVLNGPSGPYVYVADNDNKAQYRQVKIGIEYEDLIVVTEGLAAGERVVTEGQVRLGPNTQVEDVDKGGQRP
jgi:multidrug efflux system membrane fusion protein